MTENGVADLKNALKQLFSSYGYVKYRMSGFEEYSLYMENRNFLISDKIITFNDLDGRLMALKPDVTLSIVKNALPEKGIAKYYYTESVYRPDRANTEFRELTQTGLEALGEIDGFTTAETVELALKGLSLTGADHVLALSDVRFSEGLLNKFAPNAENREYLTEVISRKSLGELDDARKKGRISDEGVNALKAVITLPQNASEALDIAARYAFGKEAESAIKELRAIVNAFKGTRFEENIQIDFSLTGNTRYYNGILFSGYVKGVAGAVLKGGRYDKLLDTFSTGKGAIGFALYTDEIENLFAEPSCGPDVAVVYGEGADAGELMKTMAPFREKGLKAVAVSRRSFTCAQGRIFVFEGGTLTEEK